MSMVRVATKTASRSNEATIEKTIEKKIEKKIERKIKRKIERKLARTKGLRKQRVNGDLNLPLRPLQSSGKQNFLTGCVLGEILQRRFSCWQNASSAGSAHEKGLVLMISLFLLFSLSLVAVSGASVSRLGVYASQSFVDDYVASNAAYAAMDHALDNIADFRANQFSGSGGGGKYLVPSFARRWQDFSAWQSVNCLSVDLLPAMAAASPCVLVEALDGTEISTPVVYRVSAQGIGSVPQTHVVIQAWVYQYFQTGTETVLITELRGLKEL